MRIVRLILIIICTVCFSNNTIAKTIRINNNKPIQEQFILKGATYVIKNNIDLKGDTLSVPSRSRIKFTRKGLLTNGTLIGNNTLIAGHPRFDGLRLKGSFVNKKYYTSWCSHNTISDYIEDVMNLSKETSVIVDCNITMNDRKSYVTHLSLEGKKKTVINSDRFYITYGGTQVTNLCFLWDKPEVIDPADNYSAVVVYHNLLEKDTTVVVKIENVVANGGHFCSYFMRQYKSSINSELQTINTIQNCSFSNFTRGAIWTCGGSGQVTQCNFLDIGYDKTKALRSVTALRLGYNNETKQSIASGYTIENCSFNNIVAAYNPENDGRELHGLLTYGDSLIVRNNSFCNLSTSFLKETDAGKDSEMLYIKGSYNVIESNTFENGAGQNSNGVVTLKFGASVENTVRNNKFLNTNTTAKFIYLCGCNHIIEGNTFKSIVPVSKEDIAYAIYLGHRDNVICKESVVINNNLFSFGGNDNYMAVYANRWGDITLSSNVFNNPKVLIKCNNRAGSVYIHNNQIVLDGIYNKSDSFMLLTGKKGGSITISHNEITLGNSIVGYLVKGSNCDFRENKVKLINVSMQSLFLSAEDKMKVTNNFFSIDKDSRISKSLSVVDMVSNDIKYY